MSLLLRLNEVRDRVWKTLRPADRAGHSDEHDQDSKTDNKDKRRTGLHCKRDDEVIIPLLENTAKTGASTSDLD